MHLLEVVSASNDNIAENDRTKVIGLAMYVTDGSDRTSSMPSTVLRLLVDKGQGLRSGLLVSINRVLPVH